MPSTLDIIENKTTKNSTKARGLYESLVDGWDIPTKLTREGELADISAAKHLARDGDAFEERFGESGFFLRLASGSVEQADEGADESDVVSRAAEVVEDRAAGVIDAGVVQDSTPIEVDNLIVDIQDSAAPLRQYVTSEAQPGFIAQFNIISGRNAPTPGKVTEGEAIDLSDNDNADWSLEDDQKEMTIYVDRMTMSDFTQRAWDSLNWGTNDIEETTVGQSAAKHARFTTWEMVYGDPDAVDPAEGAQIQGENAAASLAYWANFADTEDLTDIDHRVDKSAVAVNAEGDETAGLEELKTEITELVTETGAEYSDLLAVCGPDAFNQFENEGNFVVRLGGYDDDMSFGGRRIDIKSGVELVETRMVGKDSVEDVDFDTEAGVSDWAPDEGDVFVFDTSAFRRRQLAPASSVPLARRGLSDEAALFEYYNNIDKSHGAHIKFLEGFDI